MSTKVKATLFASIGFLLMSSTSVFSQCVVPNILANGQVADANQVMSNFDAIAGCVDNAAPAGSQNALQYNSGSGSFGAVGPLTSGQVVIGVTGGSPQAGTLTAGPGIAVLNSPGGITITATGGGGGGGGGVDWLNAAAVVRPLVSNFSLLTSSIAPTGATLSATTRGVVLKSTSGLSSTAMMAETSVPSGSWEATMLAVYTGPVSNFNLPGIAVRDSVNSKAVVFGIGGGATAFRFDYEQFNGGAGLDNYVSDTGLQDVGLPPPYSPIWSRLTYDGTNFIWSFSRDGENFTGAFSVSATAHITNRNTIGPAVTFQQPTRPTWLISYHILSWSLVSL
jgi:hypothetical protein